MKYGTWQNSEILIETSVKQMIDIYVKRQVESQVGLYIELDLHEVWFGKQCLKYFDYTGATKSDLFFLLEEI